jgi:hypothetical protein
MSGRAARTFFASRWRGEVPLARVFWRDTLLVGSLLNVVSGIATVMLMKAGAPVWAVALAHFIMLPYNLFLVAATWQAARRQLWPRVGALVWLGAATLV